VTRCRDKHSPKQKKINKKIREFHAITASGRKKEKRYYIKKETCWGDEKVSNLSFDMFGKLQKDFWGTV
jgi:hypothetical protein